VGDLGGLLAPTVLAKRAVGDVAVVLGLLAGHGDVGWDCERDATALVTCDAVVEGRNGITTG